MMHRPEPSPVKQMNQAEWDAIGDATRDSMAEYVFGYTTPISRSEDLLHGWGWGTGNYLELNGAPYLLTNEHVAVKAIDEYIAHLPGPTDDYVLCNSSFEAWPHPYDIALSQLHVPPSSAKHKLVTVAQLDPIYNPVAGELLFWLGYPGSTAVRTEPITPLNARYSWFNHLATPGIPVLSQQLQAWPTGLPSDFRPSEHAIVHYPTHARTVTGALETEVPNASGMSGSLLWDTKRVACLQNGEEWSPEKARVCGILWATYLNPDIVVATKVEFLHSALSEVISLQQPTNDT
jgi:hypothetical protein